MRVLLASRYGSELAKASIGPPASKAAPLKVSEYITCN
jgi:hypothetical protein